MLCLVVYLFIIALFLCWVTRRYHYFQYLALSLSLSIYSSYRRPRIIKLGLHCGCCRSEECNMVFVIPSDCLGKCLASSLQVLCISCKFLASFSQVLCKCLASFLLQNFLASHSILTVLMQLSRFVVKLLQVFSIVSGVWRFQRTREFNGRKDARSH